jgi:hypothetical protein
MTLDEQHLRADLRSVTLPADLVPPPDLADTALARVRRRRVRTVVVGLAVAGVLLATGIRLRPGPGGTGFDPVAPPTTAAPTTAALVTGEPTFPRPGGGPVSIYSYLDPMTEHTYVLNVETGQYDEYPYPVVLSPDLSRAAIVREERIGIVDRSALGDPAPTVDWTTLPPGNGLCWSPDGKKVLITSVDKSSGTVGFTAHAYDLATKRTTQTRIGDSATVAGTAGWAADSTDYLVSPVTPDNTGFTFHGLRRVGPDGQPVRTLADVAGGLVHGADSYSPDRRYVIVDPTPMMTDNPRPAQVVDVASGAVVRSLPDKAVPVGWYGPDTVAYRVGGHLIRYELTTGPTGRPVDVSGLGSLGMVRLGPSVDGPAAARGF